MQLFLSLADSHKDSPNENFARELMELFTLGRRLRRARRARGGPRADRLARVAARRAGRRHLVRQGALRRRRQAPARPPRPLRHPGGARSRRRQATPRAVPRVQAVGLLRHRAAGHGHEARARPRSTAAAASASCRSSRRSSATARSTRTSTTPTWSRAPSCSSPARCARARAPITTDGYTWLLVAHGADAVQPAERRRLGLGHRVADERHDQARAGRRQQPHRVG